MNTELGVVASVRVSRSNADLDAVEAARVPDPKAAVEELFAVPAVEEAFVIQTCHRVEAYVVVEDVATGREVLDGRFDGETAGHEASLRHLLRVAAGLESLVLGEDQVLGQVREAYADAREVGALGPVLGDAVTKATHVGERARTETAINEGATSLGSAAVRLAERERDLAGETALVVGAGEMGTLAARALAASAVGEVIVANRTVERAEEIAADLDCPARATGLSGVDGALAEAPVAVTATGSADPVFDADAFAGAGETLVVDLAQPPDVAPDVAERPGVSVYDSDDLEAVTGETRARRERAAGAVADMVDRELDRLLQQYKRKRADEVIAAMYAGADRVKERELDTAFSQLEAAGGLTDDQREAVESLADALVAQLLAAPTKSLRDAAAEDDWETIHTALRLFDPEFGDDGPDGAPIGALDALSADDD